jgi:hypothetical protein
MTTTLLIGLGLTFLIIAGALWYRRRQVQRLADLPDIPPFLQGDGAPPGPSNNLKGELNALDWTEIHPLPKTIRSQGGDIRPACEMNCIKTPGYDTDSIAIVVYTDSPIREAMYRHMEEAEQSFITVMLNRLRRRLRNAAH